MSQTLRILADVTPDQLNLLDAMAQQQATSRAEIIRRAIATYIGDKRPPLSSYFGIWQTEESEPEDGVAFQDRLRSEW